MNNLDAKRKFLLVSGCRRPPRPRLRHAAWLGIATALALPGAGAARADEEVAQVGPAPGSESQASGAATQKKPENQLEEIIVTARYRTEDVQTTPISITAMTGDQMEERGYTSVIDVAASAPNVTIMPAAGVFGKSAQAFIRGVGQADFDYAVSPGVGFYVDDVYFDSVAGSELDLLDLDRVEVLRGPQGTLFGKNTEGGAVRLFTVKPTGDDSGYVEAGYGSYNRLRYRGAFDVSLVPDKVFVRVSGGSNTDDGYQKLIDFACAHPNLAGSLKPTTTAPGCQVGTLGGQDVQDGRVAIRAVPTDGLEINLEADILNDHSESPADTELAVNSNTTGTGLGVGPGAPFGSNPYAGTTLFNFNNNYLLPRYGFQINRATLPPNPYVSYMSLTDPVTGLTAPNEDTQLQYGFTNTIDWDAIPDLVHVKSISAYRSFTGDVGYATAPTPYPLAFALQTVSHTQVSQEEDLTGAFDLLGNKLEWTAGGYYLNSDNGNGGWVEVADNLSSFPQLATSPVTLPNGIHYAPGQLIPAGSPEPDAWSVQDKATDDTEAGFLHWIYHITDALSFEGGYRYSVENRSYIFQHNYIYTTVPEAPLVPPGTTGIFHFPRSDAKAAFQYQVSPELMTYASVSTGFKAGGINPRPLDAQQVYPFKPEDLTAYELGVKSQWFDNRLRFNADGFLSDYKNLQQSALIFDPAGILGNVLCFCYENVGHVLIEGVEAELQTTPLPGLNLNAGVGYLDWNTLTLGSVAIGGVKRSLQSLTPGSSATPWPENIPKWKFSVGGQYTYDMGTYGSLTERLDWIYQSRVFFDPLDTAVFAQNGYGLLNAHVTWTAPDANWQAVMQVSNVTNQLYYLNKFVNYAGGDANGQPGQPREFLFTVRRMFGPASPTPAAYTPPPPPAPAPAASLPPAPKPEAQREFQVFFDFDKSDITDAAARVIQAAADVVKLGGVAHITVTGHTDTVGTAAYNQGLSERRAAAVRTALVAAGVNGGEIATMGVGKTGLLVPTGDGVRESQNRRAVIDLQ